MILELIPRCFCRFWTHLRWKLTVIASLCYFLVFTWSFCECNFPPKIMAITFCSSQQKHLVTRLSCWALNVGRQTVSGCSSLSSAPLPSPERSAVIALAAFKKEVFLPMLRQDVKSVVCLLSFLCDWPRCHLVLAAHTDTEAKFTFPGRHWRTDWGWKSDLNVQHLLML